MIVKIDPDDARSWGREAFEMGLTLAEARESIAQCGCPPRLLALVDETYNHARANAVHMECDHDL